MRDENVPPERSAREPEPNQGTSRQSFKKKGRKNIAQDQEQLKPGENKLNLNRSPATSALPQPPSEAERKHVAYWKMIERDFGGVEPWLYRQQRLRPRYAEDFHSFESPVFGEENPSKSIRIKRKLASLATAIANPIDTVRRGGTLLLDMFCGCFRMVDTPRIFVKRPSNEEEYDEFRRASESHETPKGSLDRSRQNFAHLKKAGEINRSRHLLKPPKVTQARDCEGLDKPKGSSRVPNRNNPHSVADETTTDDPTTQEEGPTTPRSSIDKRVRFHEGGNGEGSWPEVDAVFTRSESTTSGSSSTGEGEDDAKPSTSDEGKADERPSSTAPRLSLDTARFGDWIAWSSGV